MLCSGKKMPIHKKHEPANTNKREEKRSVDGVAKTKVINAHSAQLKTLPVTSVRRKGTSKMYAEAPRKWSY